MQMADCINSFPSKSMEKPKYQFKAISRLQLFDIKAQKKTIPFKKFCSIPLTYEETMKENFDSFKNSQFPYYSPHNPRRKTCSNLKLKRLSEPKVSPFASMMKENNMEAANSIMKKCGNLIKGATKYRKRMAKFERYSEECLGEFEKRVDLIIAEGASSMAYG